MSRRGGKQGRCVVLLGLAAMLSLYSTVDNVEKKDDLVRNQSQEEIPKSIHSVTAAAISTSHSPSIHNTTPTGSIGLRVNPVVPVPFHTRTSGIPRYHRIPLINSEGYQPTGGELPFDPADSLFSPRMWRLVDNNTCREDSDYTPEPWQYRAPYAILLGAMKAGTHAVIESLWDHPSVVRTGHWELHFFDSSRAIRSDRGINRTLNLQNYGQAVRMAMGRNGTVEASLLDNHHQVMIESTPKYLLNSDRIPDFLLCVVPWVKLIAILRDPVARAESHYRYLDESRRASNLSMVDWQLWVEDDLRLLAGVLNATSPEEEYYEWKLYQRTPNSQQIIGRGLYVISLEHYLAAMDRIHTSRSDLWVIQSERFLKARQEEYDKLLQFLQLPPHILHNASAKKIHATSHGALPMPGSIRQRLKHLYQPYNARLYRLLGWENVWD